MDRFSYVKNEVNVVPAIAAVTTTTTSNAILVAGAKAIGLEVYSEAVSETQDRAGNFKITVSMDGGTTFRDYNMLLSNVTNSNEQNLTRVATLALTAGSAQNAIAWLDPMTLGAITHIKVVFTRTTEGTKGTFTSNVSVAY
jgi:hypothetical protein